MYTAWPVVSWGVTMFNFLKQVYIFLFVVP